MKRLVCLFGVILFFSTITYGQGPTIDYTQKWANSGFEASISIEDVASMICRFAYLLFFLAGGLAAVTIVSAGIKWTASSDDPGARKHAKEMVIAAVIGLIIVLVANALVLFVLSSLVEEGLTQGCGWAGGSS